MARKRRARRPTEPHRPGTSPERARARATHPNPRDRVLVGSVLGVLLLLAVLGDDRHAGLVADGRQMLRTAVAIAEVGEIGQARGRDFTLERGEGDGVSRFGMATSLLQVPAALAAPVAEARLGAGRSQALFLIVPWLAVGLIAAAAGTIARRLGGGDVEVVAAVLLASAASPMGSYATMEFSEPIQAAGLTVALGAALAAAESSRPRRGLAFAAGFAAGVAVLAKSSLILCVPAVLLPLADIGDLRRSRGALLGAGAGAAGPLLVWAAFELLRFGQFFGGYPDDRFTHPWLDGLWRLLVGPNRGLLLFWPALLLFVWAGRRWRGAWKATPAARAWLGAGAVLALQVAVAAGYWGWHGMEGWGPRLILAGVPPLAPFAATSLSRRQRPALIAVTLLCLAANVPPLIQHPTPVATYVTNVAWPAIPATEASRYPFYARSQSGSGQPTVVPFAVLDMTPAANPWRSYVWFWRITHLPDARLADRLLDPPWASARPDLVPDTRWPPEIARQVAPPPRVGFLGRSLTGTGGPYATFYLEALLDQVVRANQRNQTQRALDLSAKRLRLHVDGEAAAWRLESLRRAGRGTEAEALLRTLPESTRRHPLINVVLALFDRDGGEERRARALLASVAPGLRLPQINQALGAPLSTWPATLDGMTRAPRRDAIVAAPD